MSKELNEEYCEEYLRVRQKASYTFLKQQHESKQNQDDTKDDSI